MFSEANNFMFFEKLLSSAIPMPKNSYTFDIGFFILEIFRTLCDLFDLDFVWNILGMYR